VGKPYHMLVIKKGDNKKTDKVINGNINAS